jgi:hypothetical protein
MLRVRGVAAVKFLVGRKKSLRRGLNFFPFGQKIILRWAKKKFGGATAHIAATPLLRVCIFGNGLTRLTKFDCRSDCRSVI